MPKVSEMGNVTKRCGCKRPYVCDHPWHYYTGTGESRTRGNLDKLLGWHPADYTTARTEAMRIIVAVSDQPMRQRLYRQLLRMSSKQLAAVAEFVDQMPREAPTGSHPCGVGR